MPRTVRAYAITSEAVARERERVGGDVDEMDVSRVIELDKLDLPDLGPGDVHLRILAVSAEHNIAHAALADTVNIAEARGGRIYPGNSAVGEVIDVGSAVTDFKSGDVVITHCNGEPDEFGFPLRIWAYDQPESVGWYAEEAVVGDWQIIKAPVDCGLNLWEIAALPQARHPADQRRGHAHRVRHAARSRVPRRLGSCGSRGREHQRRMATQPGRRIQLDAHVGEAGDARPHPLRDDLRVPRRHRALR